MALLRRRKRKRGSSDLELNVIPLADIFTIILVFLLKSFASSAGGSDQDIKLPDQLKLPVANPLAAKTNGLLITILENKLILATVSGEELGQIPLKGYQFKSSDIGFSKHFHGTSKTLESLLKTNRKENTELLVLADENSPYSTIQQVIATAASGGLKDFKLGVRSAE